MKIKLFGALFVLVTFVSCELGTKLTKETKETVVTGTTTILVDETILPIVEDVVAVFENEYKNAKINLIAKPEGEIIRLLKEDKSKIAILARNLSRSEMQYYSNKNVIPRITEFGEDAVVFIANHSNALETISIDQFASKLKGTSSKSSSAIVFENPESSTLAFLKSKLAIDTLDSKAVFSMKDSKELIRFIAANKNAVGIVGVNWLLQPSLDIEKEVQNVKILGIHTKGIIDGKPWVKPNQSNIADHSYPWTRKLYLLNFQGAKGLGMGFASYIAGENGQRILLKSGLSPIKFPSREINIKGSIE
jgi:phosphate transport system substrate-binding protein